MSIDDVHLLVSPLPLSSSSPYHSPFYLFLPLPFSHQFALLPTFNTSLPPSILSYPSSFEQSTVVLRKILQWYKSGCLLLKFVQIHVM